MGDNATATSTVAVTKKAKPPKKKVKAKKKEVKEVSGDDDSKAEMGDEPSVVIPYEQLKLKQFGGVEVEVKKLQNYLSNAEFKAIFKMTRSDFDTKPAWKQRALKKAASLF